jgi:hypothetical protein
MTASICISVRRRDDGFFFVGDIPITFDPDPRYAIPPLSSDTREALGHPRNYRDCDDRHFGLRPRLYQ